MRSTKAITIEFDLDKLGTYTDSHLALLWHLGQANPAAHGDYNAGDITAKIGHEIIRRWLRSAPVEMYHHQPTDNPLRALGRFAKYVPGCDNVMVSGRFHDGEWVSIDEFDERRAAVTAARREAATVSPEELAPYAGNMVAIADKQIIASAPTMHELVKFLNDNNLDADGARLVPAPASDEGRQT